MNGLSINAILDNYDGNVDIIELMQPTDKDYARSFRFFEHEFTDKYRYLPFISFSIYQDGDFDIIRFKIDRNLKF